MQVQWRNLYNASSVEQSLHWKEPRSWAFGGIVCMYCTFKCTCTCTAWVAHLNAKAEGGGEKGNLTIMGATAIIYKEFIRPGKESILIC